MKEKIVLSLETLRYKHILRISWTKHVMNENVFRRIGNTKNSLKILKTRKAELVGHILIENVIWGNGSGGRSPLYNIGRIVRDTDCGW